VLTDPPYGIDYQSQRRKDKSTWKPKIQNDKKPFLDWIKLIKPKIKQTGGYYVSQDGLYSKNLLMSFLIKE
jgi:DNA modification methylase